MKTAVLEIQGMGCSGCANTVEKALSELKGVESASVELETNEATVTYAESSVGSSDFIQAVNDAGYKMTGIK